MTAVRAWLARHGLNILGWTLMAVGVTGYAVEAAAFDIPSTALGRVVYVAVTWIFLIAFMVGALLARPERRPQPEVVVPDTVPDWMVREEAQRRIDDWPGLEEL